MDQSILDNWQSYCDAAEKQPGAVALAVDSRELAALIAEVRACRAALDEKDGELAERCYADGIWQSQMEVAHEATKRELAEARAALDEL